MAAPFWGTSLTSARQKRFNILSGESSGWYGTCGQLQQLGL